MKEQLDNQIRACSRCNLCVDLPDGFSPVPGEGSITSPIMVVGEALGETEVLYQAPFQGRAGQLLNKILTESGFNRDDIYITNVVKCRPTKNSGKANRPPTDLEISKCKIWLWKEIQLIKPKVIMTLGKVPTYTLLNKVLKKAFKLSDIVGKEYEVNFGELTSIIIPVYHPSFLMVHSRKDIDRTIQIFRDVNSEVQNMI